MNRGVGSLPLLGMLVGQFFACAYIIWQQPRYLKKFEANKQVNVPEWRLSPMVLGGTLFSIGMFWFGWSGYRSDIHWIVPILSGLFTGFGNFMIILQAQNYLLDAYLSLKVSKHNPQSYSPWPPHYSSTADRQQSRSDSVASAIAANTFARSIAGAGFPMFATYMFSGMGVQWTSTLLGCVAAIMVTIPIAFYKYGGRIRVSSKFGLEQERGKKQGFAQLTSKERDMGQQKCLLIYSCIGNMQKCNIVVSIRSLKMMTMTLSLSLSIPILQDGNRWSLMPFLRPYIPWSGS